MKFLIKPCILFIILGLSASCSRQFSGINSSQKFATISELQATKTVYICKKNSITDDTCRCIGETANKNNSPSQLYISNQPFTKKDYPVITKLKEKAINGIHYVMAYPPAFNVLQKHVADRGEPQINKGGFILIGAAILAFFLHLIIYACIALAIIGLIILLSPLFRKRY